MGVTGQLGAVEDDCGITHGAAPLGFRTRFPAGVRFGVRHAFDGVSARNNVPAAEFRVVTRPYAVLACYGGLHPVPLPGAHADGGEPANNGRMQEQEEIYVNKLPSRWRYAAFSARRPPSSAN